MTLKEENTPIPLDVLTKEFFSKIDQIKTIVNNDIYHLQSNESFNEIFNQMIKYLEQISAVISNNLDFLTNTILFQNGFNRAINTIYIAIDSFIKSFNSITSPQENPEKVEIITNEIINFSESFKIFSTNFLEIMENKSSTTNPTLINARLGLESTLFNFCVKIDQTDEFPFFNSKSLSVYKCYDTVNNISEPIAAIQSFCGTGKTSIVPLILMCKSLKENFSSPFVILVQPSEKHVENVGKFFKSLISPYATIITELDELIEIENNFEKNHENQEKFVFGILQSYNLLQLLYNFRTHPNFYKKSRFIIDEVQKRSICLDVLIAKLAEFDEKHNVFQIPLNVTFMSATICPQLLNPFHGKVAVTSLITKSRFEISEKPPIMEHFIDKIDSEVVRDEVIKVVEEMAKIKSSIERGHILCFMSSVLACNNVINSTTSLLNENEENEERRKIVVLQTTLKMNESIESFIKRLSSEYEVKEEIHKASESNGNKHDVFYVLPLIFSGLAEDAISELAMNEFPFELRKITKLICSTPVSETFNYEGISVVIDSGLVKQAEFNVKTGLTTMVNTQASNEIMFQRKGRLGRSMKGLYISVISNKNRPEFQVPPIQRTDLTKDVLMMKDIEINVEKMTNLPDEPNSENIQYALDFLTQIRAVDKETSMITPLGHEMLRFSFIPIYYSAASIRLKDKFPEKEGSKVHFIGIILSEIIAMENILFKEQMSENLSRFFCEESDVVTIFNALNYLFKIDKSNQNMKDIVESYGFWYTGYLKIKENISKAAKIIKPGKIDDFITKYGILRIVDLLINEIKIIDTNWNDIHYLKFNRVKGAGGLKRNPVLIFEGSKLLKSKKQRGPTSEVIIDKRPGWNGISIPAECYCLKIIRNNVFHTNKGQLIHRYHYSSTSAIMSIEVGYYALNPWFNVLLNIYFKDENLGTTSFQNNDYNKSAQEEKSEDGQMFHFSNIGGRVFISYIVNNLKDKTKIKTGIKECLAIFPYTPKGVLIFREDVDTLIQVRLIGTERYDILDATSFHGSYLDKEKIDFFVSNIDKLKGIEPEFIICSLFVRKSCKLNEYVQNKLFFVNNNQQKYPSILESVYEDEIVTFEEKTYVPEKLQSDKKEEISNQKEVNFFEFPPTFIHPSLFYHQESLACILNWFSNFCSNVHVIKVIGHRILMNSNEIRPLQIRVRREGKKIKDQMNLNYVAIPVSSNVYSKTYMQIKENPLWKYDERFRVIVTTKKEASKVKEFIQKESSKSNKNLDCSIVSEYLSGSTLCCICTCDDPENPVLSKAPLTLYFEDGSTYTSKICRDCILECLQISTSPYKGDIDENTINNFLIEPKPIPIFPSKINESHQDYWPQIPLGQLVSLLISNDTKTSIEISSWLSAVSECAIRARMKERFTFCPLHPQHIFDIEKPSFDYKCKDPECKNMYCLACNGWHDSDKKCLSFINNCKFCPKCKALTVKISGCNHITCICGCHWCYKCGEGFTTPDLCYDHLEEVHGGFYDDDDDNDEYD